MKITEDLIQHVAKLARLELTPEETGRYTQDLTNILNMVDDLSSLDMGEAAVNADDATQKPVLRADEANRDFTAEMVLKNAPCEENGFFRVPKILEDAT